MIRILVTGSQGQLGSELRTVSPEFPHFDFIFIDLPELDLTDGIAVGDYFQENEFDVVINCAAYTAVDKAEEEPGNAMKVNRDAVKYLARECKNAGSYFIHLSTDYVFDGKGDKPYRENDRTNPQTVYGHSKLAGEEAIMACLNKGLIIRTSWLYSSFGNNFVKTILKKSRESDTLRVVSDQLGNPTYARDLAKAILYILPAALAENKFFILHYSNEGICSWYDFAIAIVALAGIPCEIKPVSTAEYPFSTPRPAFSALDKSTIVNKFGLMIPGWKDALGRCLEEIKHRA